MFIAKLQALLLVVVFFDEGKSLLFHNNGYPTTSTPVGPLGLEATVSLLVQEINRMNVDMKAQVKEIVDLKMMLSVSNSTSTSTIQHLLDELKTLNSTVSSIRTDLDLINHSSGTQIILQKVNNIAQSVRYLTLSLQDQETKIEANNRSLHKEVYQLKSNLGALSLGVASLNSTEISDIADLQSHLTTAKSSVTSLQTKTQFLQSQIIHLRSSLGSVQSHALQLLRKSIAMESLFGEFQYIVFKGFENGHLTSALVYQGTRLVGGNSTSGRVEITVNGIRGTVCGDYFDRNRNAAKVVCRSLGKPWQNAEYTSMFDEGDKSNMILLDDVKCNGSEGTINNCTHLGFGVHNCHHREDIGVICSKYTGEICII